MSTPTEERPEPTYNMHSNMHVNNQQRSSDDNTFVNDDVSPHATQPVREGTRLRSGSHLTVDTAHFEPGGSIKSPSQSREQASRLDDDLVLLQLEQQISQQDHLNREQSQTRTVKRERSKREEVIDEFDAATNPLHEKTAMYKPPEHPATSFSKFFKKVHNSVWLIRYFIYIIPLVLIILIPLLLGALLFKNTTVGGDGGVTLVWFCIWLEIVWLTLWAGRVRFFSQC